MLVLSRKVGESISIAGGIRVIVQKFAGGKVSLAIEAPKETKIMREELLHRAPAEGKVKP